MTRFAEPIFLGGLSHSGKTQLRLALDEIPTLSFTRRTQLWDRILQRFGDLGDEGNLGRCLEAMGAISGVGALEPDLEALRIEFSAGPPTYERLICLFHQQVAERRGKIRWGDQTKSIERYGSIILEAFPYARMIHMVRDPRRLRDVRSRTTPRLRAALGSDTARWIASMEAARANRARFGSRYLVIRYEDLVADTEGTVRTVCGFIDEDVPESARDVISSIRFQSVGDSDSMSQSAARWDEGRPRSDDRFVTMHAADLLAEHGYRTAYGKMSLSESARFAVTWPARRASMAAWRSLDKRTRPS
ncbi:MAG: sulfotransferase [Acidimicrobiia bacterium]|nr:sulfotransferase [Acidimicrobiia bacterium]